MNADTLILEKHLKKTTIVSNVFSMVIALGTAIIVVNTFYYKTTQAIENHSQQILDVKKDVVIIKDKMNNTEVFQGVTSAEREAMNAHLNNVDLKVDKMNDKLDMILIQMKK